MGKGGGGGGGTQDVYQTNIHEDAIPYHLDIIEAAMRLGTEQPYPFYIDEGGNPIARIAGFAPEQMAAQQARVDMFNRGDPWGQHSANMMGGAANALGTAGSMFYAPQYQNLLQDQATNPRFNAPYVSTNYREPVEIPNAPPDGLQGIANLIGQSTVYGDPNIVANDYDGSGVVDFNDWTQYQKDLEYANAGTFDADQSYNRISGGITSQYDSPGLNQQDDITSQFDFSSGLGQPTFFDEGGFEAAGGLYTDPYAGSDPTFGDRIDFRDQDIESYMNPYDRAVTDQAIDAATDAYQMDLNVSDAQNVAEGSRGSYRAMLGDMLRASDYQGNVADIRAQGQARSFENAQQQFERDRSTAIRAAEMGDRSALEAANMRMRAFIEDRNANITSSQLGLQAADTSARYDMQAAMANLEEGRAARELQERANQFSSAQNFQAQVQNQAMILQATGMDQQAAQQSAQIMLQADMANQEQAMRAMQMGDESAYRDAVMRMQAQEQNRNAQFTYAREQMAQAQMSGALGSEAQTRMLGMINELNRVGVSQQEMEQNVLNLAYDDFIKQYQHPQSQLNWMQAVVAGAPTVQHMQTFNSGPQNSGIADILSLGLGAGALGKMFG